MALSRQCWILSIFYAIIESCSNEDDDIEYDNCIEKQLKEDISSINTKCTKKLEKSDRNEFRFVLI